MAISAEVTPDANIDFIETKKVRTCDGSDKSYQAGSIYK